MKAFERRHLDKSASVTIATAGLVLALAIPGTALAEPGGKVTTDFPFIAGSTQCPAGTYEFRIVGKAVWLRSTDPEGPTAVMLVATRLARHDEDEAPAIVRAKLGRSDKEPQNVLVFDKVGDQLRLSEIWPAYEDGYLVLVTAEQHKHRTVGGSSYRD